MEEQYQKQTYDEKKRLREDEARKNARNSRLRKILIWSFGITLIILLAKYTISSIRDSARINDENANVSEVVGEFFKSQGADHIKVGADHPSYSSSPPTSGWHYDAPHASGVFTEEFADEQLIHNLEHGHIWIAYKPDLDPAVVQQLKDVAYRFRSKIIMAPRSKNGTPIILSAWEYQLKLQQFDLNQVLGFIKAHRGKGPEDIPDIGF